MEMEHMAESLRYADAGVDVSVWNSTKTKIGELVSSTFNKDVMGKFGQFGGMYDIAPLLSGGAHPVLVSSTDSVGTKVMIAIQTNRHSTVGIDIVNHCVNDILVLGARPLFFLDYIGINKLIPEMALQLIEGLTNACKANGCVLIGGETAEMPGVYKKGDYDLVGTIIGVVDKSEVVDGSFIVPGDCLIGLRSSGLHTNGYSLARKIVTEVAGKNYTDPFGDSGLTFVDVLLKPHRSYLPILPLLRKKVIKGCAHITGGGFQDNIDRILPENCDASINLTAWDPDPIYHWMQKQGNVERDEMYHTFNMGIGMVLAVSPAECEKVMKSAELSAFSPVMIGTVIKGTGKVVFQ
jgi:phosphoribosylformylglycinamidine cyclo-ligase